jgi:hypothetical protein
MDKTYADEADLLGDYADETKDVETSKGLVVVRPLTRIELVEAKRKAKGDEADYESRLISKALVRPELTPGKVKAWFGKAPAGDSVAIMDAVAELSGMAEGARKSGVPGA